MVKMYGRLKVLNFGNTEFEMKDKEFDPRIELSVDSQQEVRTQT